MAAPIMTAPIARRERAAVADASYGPEAFAREWDVSRETLDRVERYAGLLAAWQPRINLVSDASLDDLWRRHFRDSAQLVPLLPGHPCSIADVGAGGGFPGLVLAALRPDCAVTLIEATAKKAAFLQEVVARTGILAHIRNTRVERLVEPVFDVVTARACAPLGELLELTEMIRGGHTVCIFPKGAKADDEIRAAQRNWTMTVERFVSLTDPAAAILRLTEIRRG